VTSSVADSLRIDPSAERPSITKIMARGFPIRNEAFKEYANNVNNCVDQDTKDFKAWLAEAKTLAGEGGKPQGKDAQIKSPLQVGYQLPVRNEANQTVTSPITDVNMVATGGGGHVVGFVYRTQSGDLAIQDAVPSSTVSDTHGKSVTFTGSLNKAPITVGASISKTSLHGTVRPNQGDVVPLTQLSQIPKRSVVQPIEEGHRQLVKGVPHQRQDDFESDNTRPNAYVYEFRRGLIHASNTAIEKVSQASSRALGKIRAINDVLRVREGENAEISAENGQLNVRRQNSISSVLDVSQGASVTVRNDPQGQTQVKPLPELPSRDAGR
jgi:hypothetical protein